MLSEDTRHRAAKGLSARSVDATLQATAQQLAELLAAPGAPFTHAIGGGMERRLAANGWKGMASAENIAYGNDTAAETFVQWMGSPGHRANILGDCSLCGFGHAVSRDGTHYWAANYGTKAPTGGGTGGGGGRVPWWRWVLNWWR